MHLVVATLHFLGSYFEAGGRQKGVTPVYNVAIQVGMHWQSASSSTLHFLQSYFEGGGRQKGVTPVYNVAMQVGDALTESKIIKIWSFCMVYLLDC